MSVCCSPPGFKDWLHFFALRGSKGLAGLMSPGVVTEPGVVAEELVFPSPFSSS